MMLAGRILALMAAIYMAYFNLALVPFYWRERRRHEFWLSVIYGIISAALGFAVIGMIAGY